jgi:hypothetical protein
MDFANMKQNITNSIKEYRNLFIPFTPNQDERDKELLSALDKATTIQQLGVLGAMRSDRFAYLTKGVEPLKCSYMETVGMQFDVGTTGWYFIYGLDKEGKNGFLIIFFRSPTKGNASAKDTYYNITGNVIEDNKYYPFSTPGYPIIATGNYSENTGNISLDINLPQNDSNVFLTKLNYSSLGYMTNTNIELELGGKSYSFNLTAKSRGVMQGTDGGCVPCFDGIGTNYWSFPYLSGTMSMPSKTVEVVGWFDHQYGILQKAPKSCLTQAFLTAQDFFMQPKGIDSWYWLTAQFPEDNVFYTASFFPKGKIHVGQKTHSEKAGNKFTINPATGEVIAERNIPATVEVSSLVNGTNYTNDVVLTIDGKVIKLKSIADGFVTLADGSKNIETPAIASISDKKGVGFIENNKMGNPNDDIEHACALAGIDNSKPFFPSKYSFKKAILSILFLLFIAIVVLLVLVFIVMSIVRLARSSF